MAKLKKEGARKYLGFCEISTFLGTKKGTLRFEEDKFREVFFQKCYCGDNNVYRQPLIIIMIIIRGIETKESFSKGQIDHSDHNDYNNSDQNNPGHHHHTNE